MDGGIDNVMVILSVALVTRMNCLDVGVRQSHPLVSLYALCCSVTTGQKDSAFLIHIATSLKTSVSPE